jgi:hypothetical protein
MWRIGMPEIIDIEPGQDGPDPSKVLLTIQCFDADDGIGFHMNGNDGVTDPHLLEIFSSLNAVVAQTIAALERKVIGKKIEDERKARKAIERSMQLNAEVGGDPN